MAWWFVAVALGTAVLTAAARRYATTRSLLDEPGERRSHTVTTPRGGGVGPVVAVGVFVALLAVSDTAAVSWGLLLAGLLAVAGVGWWDDHRPLPASLRLVVHLAAGGLLAGAFGLWTQPPYAIAAVVATAVLVNVWNFMDGINGIATTQAAIVAVLAATLLPTPLSWLALAVAAACLGFLPFNFPRARIFLGDVGSGGLGYCVAALLVAASGVHISSGLLLLLPASAFLVDAGMTLSMRMMQGERWWTPHTRHLYQGWARRAGHPIVTSVYAAWSGAGAIAALLLETIGVAGILLFTAGWYAATLFAWATLWTVMNRKDSDA